MNSKTKEEMQKSIDRAIILSRKVKDADKKSEGCR